MSGIVVLDRDGVINVDLMTYVTSPQEFRPIKGSLEAIARLNKKGFKIAIATNQACIEKGIITDNELKQTSVYSIKIKSWSGKKNWPKKADQAKNGEWPDLDKKWFDFY